MLPIHPSCLRRPRSLAGALPTGLLLALTLATPATAQLDVSVRPSSVPAVVAGPDLAVNLPLDDGTALGFVVVRPPRHGTVTPVGDDLFFTPEPSFWSVGTDSFSYRSTSSAQLHKKPGFVYLNAALHGAAWVQEDFESNTWQTLLAQSSFPVTVDGSGAITGTQGLVVDVDGPQVGSLFNTLNLRVPEGDGSPDSGGNCLRVIPPPPTNPGQFPTTGVPVRLFALGGGPGLDPGIAVDLHEIDPLVLSARMVDNLGNVFDTGPTPVEHRPGARMIYLDWWRNDESGGLKVFVDGDPVVKLPAPGQAIPNDLVLTDFQTVVSLDGAPFTSRLILDDIEVRVAGPGSASPGHDVYEPLLRDTFEDGDLDGWFRPPFIGPIFAVSGEDTSDDRHISLPVSDSLLGMLTDISPDAEPVYGVRFELGLQDLSLGQGETLTFLNLATAVTRGTSTHLTLRVREDTDGYWVRVAQREILGGAWIESPWALLPSDNSTIGLQWRAATGTLGANGRVRLWVDGEPAAELKGIVNPGMTVDVVRVGVVQKGATSSGYIHLDDFESWRAAPLPAL